MPETPTRSVAEFTIVRRFAASRDVVWRLWTDPDELTHWWHPRGLSAPREHIHVDLREGGEYSYVMVDDRTGERYPTAGRYRELRAPERLVFTWGRPDDADELRSVATVTLVESGAGTEMQFHLAGMAGHPGDGWVYDGWASAFDVLQEHLAS